jgi:hypothetical protein
MFGQEWLGYLYEVSEYPTLPEQLANVAHDPGHPR